MRMNKINPFLALGFIIYFAGCASHVRFSSKTAGGEPGAERKAPRFPEPSASDERPVPKPETVSPDATQVQEFTGEELYQEGVASYYAHEFHGRKTANGEVFDMDAMTAAHPTLPFDTRLRVENLSNGKSAVVRINDRGPFAKNRVIDLSRAAAKSIDMIGPGSARVKLYILNVK
jgi:rare lipoprotein A